MAVWMEAFWDWSLPEGEFYDESGTASAPSFCYIIDGITSIIQ